MTVGRINEWGVVAVICVILVGGILAWVSIGHTKECATGFIKLTRFPQAVCVVGYVP